MEIIVLGLVGLVWLWHRLANSRRYKARDVPKRGDKKPAQSEAALMPAIALLPQAKVLYVCDGDTVIVAEGWSETKIRLDSIDCPEDGQAWGDIARYGLIKLIGGRKVRLEKHGLDGYGRTLATIFVRHATRDEWVNVNERMVTLGNAWVSRKFYDHLPGDRQVKFDRLQNWARSRRVGLWRASNPMPPWQWRYGRQWMPPPGAAPSVPNAGTAQQ